MLKLEGVAFGADNKIFLDADALTHPDAPALWRALLSDPRRTLYVPLKAFHALNARTDAADALTRLRQAHASGRAELVGSRADIGQDGVYETMFSRLLSKYPLTFITQDAPLAARLIAAADGAPHALYVFCLKNGALHAYRRAEESGGRALLFGLTPFLPEKTPALPEPPALTRVPDTPLSADTPGAGETVNAGGRRVTLTRQIAAGGEGIIYETDTGLIAKIYKKERLTKRRAEKIHALLGAGLDCPGVCCPVAPVTDAAGRFTGFLMPAARGTELQKSVFSPALLDKRFPGWTRRDSARLAVTILEKIQYLNAHGVIIGDINPMNILVVSPEEVYFVDTDSYQIGAFPCPVGTVTFTAPERQGQPFSDFLRTQADENFALATLLFMILLPGKAPYAKQGGIDPKENLLAMDFSYPYGTKDNGLTPNGPWGALWAHLPPALQEAFFETFDKTGRFNKPETRLGPDVWLKLFSAYAALLDDPDWLLEDPDALVVFPKKRRVRKRARPKKSGKSPRPEPAQKTLICRSCRKTFPEHVMKGGLCPSCRTAAKIHAQAARVRQSVPPRPAADQKTLICRKCRGTFPDYVMKGGLCPSCRGESAPQKPNPNQKTLICRKCLKTFPDDVMKSGLCPSCRAAPSAAPRTHTEHRAQTSRARQARAAIDALFRHTPDSQVDAFLSWLLEETDQTGR